MVNPRVSSLKDLIQNYIDHTNILTDDKISINKYRFKVTLIRRFYSNYLNLDKVISISG